MADHGTGDGSGLPIALALGAALLISITINLMLFRQKTTLRLRWQEDTAQWAQEMKDATRKLDDLSAEKVRLEGELAALQASGK